MRAAGREGSAAREPPRGQEGASRATPGLRGDVPHPAPRTVRGSPSGSGAAQTHLGEGPNFRALS